MNGIVSLLDDQHAEMVETLWAELASRFGTKGIYATPFPHFSYQVAEHYEIDLLSSILARFASRCAKFRVKTTGLGVFTGPRPVLFIPLVHSLTLTLFHRMLWQEISGVGTGLLGYYTAESWVPHITLALGDLHRENLADMMKFLSDREFNWEITVSNIAFIHDTGVKQELSFCFSFNDNH